MKKNYIAPVMEVVELEVATLIAGSINAGDSLPGTSWGGDNNQGGGSADGNRHRGEWGNLWK